MNHWILEGKTPKKVDMTAYLNWLETGTRHIEKTRYGGVLVSTVFLGLDHSFGHGAPLLFETMIFGGTHDEYQERCSTYEEAEVMHEKACELVK